MSEDRAPYSAAPRPSESIGACEWCGIVSHHLLRGECPACRRRVRRDAYVLDITSRVDVLHSDDARHGGSP